MRSGYGVYPEIFFLKTFKSSLLLMKDGNLKGSSQIPFTGNS